MKKILTFLSLITIITILVFPMVGIAQPWADFTPSDCIIRHDLSRYFTCCREAVNEAGQMVGWVCLDQDDYTGDFVDWGNLTDCCLIDKILTIGDYIFTGLLVVSILVILFSAWTFLTAAGEPDKVKKARNFLLYAIIGIAVAFLAKLLVGVITRLMMV